MGKTKVNLVNYLAKTDNGRLVLSITRMTIHNGPGIRTLVSFKGCPLRCVWCSTPESQETEPQIAINHSRCTYCGRCVSACSRHAISLAEDKIIINRVICNSCGECAQVCYPEALKIIGHWMTVEQLLKEVEKDAIIYKHSNGGVTFSGGEPLLHPDFNREMFQACKDKSITVGVDTCGHVSWLNIEHILPYVDFFLWDIKHMEPAKHREFTGVSNELILSNARKISERNIMLYIRLPLIPGYNDSEENIRATCEFASTLNSVVEFNVLPMHHMGKPRYESLDRKEPIDDVPLIPENRIQIIEQLVESYGLKSRVGG